MTLSQFGAKMSNLNFYYNSTCPLLATFDKVEVKDMTYEGCTKVYKTVEADVTYKERLRHHDNDDDDDDDDDDHHRHHGHGHGHRHDHQH